MGHHTGIILSENFDSKIMIMTNHVDNKPLVRQQTAGPRFNINIVSSHLTGIWAT